MAHLGEVPHSCKSCDQKFKKWEHLENHRVRDHLGQKFTCVVCRKEYEMMNALAKHLRKIHGLNKRKLKAMEKEMEKGAAKHKLFD